MSLLRKPSFPLSGQPGEGAHMVYLHSSLKSKPTARPWQDWCIWRERVVGSRLQRATKHWEAREVCLQIHVCVQCKGRLGRFEQQGLMVKCRFYFVLCFFCSSELPSRLSHVPESWVFPSMCSVKSGCKLPFQQSNPCVMDFCDSLPVAVNSAGKFLACSNHDVS